MRRFARVLAAAGMILVLGLISQAAQGWYWGGPYFHRGGTVSVCHRPLVTPGRWQSCQRQLWRRSGRYGFGYPYHW